MKELGYGAGYQYAHDYDQAYVPQEYLPEGLRGMKWYRPTESGDERLIKERMDRWAKLKEEVANAPHGTH
jgi:putative ATPase